MAHLSPRIKQVAGALLVAILFWVYFILDPAQDFFTKCPFLWLTGWKCPGCGSQRAMHQLLHGNLLEALYFNFIFVLAFPYVIFGLILEYTDWGSAQIAIRRSWYGYWATLIVLVVVIGFGIARNIWGF